MTKTNAAKTEMVTVRMDKRLMDDLRRVARAHLRGEADAVRFLIHQEARRLEREPESDRQPEPSK